MRSSENC